MTFIDETITKVMIDYFHKQKRFTTIPDYVSYLISQQLDKMWKDENELEMKRAIQQLENKKKKK